MGCDVWLATFRLKRLGANGQMAKGKQSYAPGRLIIRPEAFSVLSRFNHPYGHILPFGLANRPDPVGPV